MAASTGSLEKKIFWKISQTPIECTYNLQLCENKGSGTGVLLWILWNFSEQFYAEQLWTAAPGC